MVGKFVFCFAGIFACYSFFATLHEKVTRGKYVDVVDGGDTGKFTYMLTLVFVQCLAYCLSAKLLLVTVMKQGEDATRKFYYVMCALTYLLAMYLSNEALQYVNYPTQVIGKAAKPIPVMILGILFAGKSYPLKKYAIVALIVAGVFLFMYKDLPTKKVAKEYYGQAMLLVSLILDGFNGTVEDKMRTEHQTKSGHMMYNVNLWSAAASGLVVLLDGEFVEFVQFLERHPVALRDIALLCLCGAAGQYFIFLTVSEFGALACSLATTTRKCFTVVVSVVLFGNKLIVRQWVAAAVVFLGLFLDALYGRSEIGEDNVARFAVIRATRFGEYVCGEA